MSSLGIIFVSHYRPKWCAFSMPRIDEQVLPDGWGVEKICVAQRDDPALALAKARGWKCVISEKPECGYKLDLALRHVDSPWVTYVTDDDIHSRNRVVQAKEASNAGMLAGVARRQWFGWPKLGVVSEWRYPKNAFTAGAGFVIRSLCARKAGGWPHVHKGFDHGFYERLAQKCPEALERVAESDLCADSMVMSHEGNLSRGRELIHFGGMEGYQDRFERGPALDYKSAPIDDDMRAVFRCFEEGESPDVGSMKRKRFSWIVPTHKRPRLVRLVVENLRRMEYPKGWDSEILVVARRGDPCWKEKDLLPHLIEVDFDEVGGKIHRGFMASSGDLVGVCGDDDFLHFTHAREAIGHYSLGHVVMVLGGFESVVVDRNAQCTWKAACDWPPIGTGLVVERSLAKEVGGWPRIKSSVDHTFRQRVQSRLKTPPALIQAKAYVLTHASSMSNRGHMSMSPFPYQMAAWRVGEKREPSDLPPPVREVMKGGYY